MARTKAPSAPTIKAKAELHWETTVPRPGETPLTERENLYLCLPLGRRFYVGCIERPITKGPTSRATKNTWTARFEWGAHQEVKHLSRETAQMVVVGIAHDAVSEIQACELVI